MEILKNIFPVAKLVKPGKVFRFLLITLVVFFATLIVKFGLFMDLKGDTVFGKAVAVGKSLFALYALLTICVNWAIYMKKSEGRGRFFKSLIGIAVGFIVIIPMATLPTYQLQEVLDAPLKSEEMNVAQIEEEFIQEDNNTVIEQYGEEVFEEETEEEVIEEVVEEPEYLIPVFDEMIEPYFDSEKGEVAIRDMLSGSVIKFTYDTDKYGVVHHEEDSVYFYWKENERDLIKITTSIDPLYPEIHSYEAHYKKLNSTGKEMQGGSVELLANCETRYMFYKEKTVAKVTSSGGSYMSAYITMPDGSNIMTPFVRVENYEKGVEFMNTLFNSFELYTAGGYTEQQGEYEHSDHLYVSRDLDDKNMAEQVVLPDYVTELFRSIEAKSENYFVFFTENGWIDGKMVVPNLKKISGDISVDTDVVLQDSIEYIDATLWGCAYPTRITMPKNLKEFNPINHRTIGDQEQTIKYLSFQESEQDAIIGNSGFSYLTVLEEVHLSNNIVYIGKHAFIGDFKLNSINLPANLKYLGDSAFERTVLTGTYVIPDGTIYMGNGVFPEGVDTLVIPASVEKLGWQNAKTIITTAGSLAEAYALERGKELIIITEEEMEQYQSIYR